MAKREALPKPASVCMANTATVKAAVAALEENLCEITDGSIEDGYLIVSDGPTKVYQALQKGSGGPWIVACYRSERIDWKSSQ